ncbi:MAG: HEAT repeat domain-containing protein [Phycisphaerales bacterium]|jgi:HEAT repeat protein|nr:HEAT repeat domain-containing protein [Phycisphaerales bacterium]
MNSKNIAKMTLAAGAVALAADQASAKTDAAAVDTAIKSLKTYDWGVDIKTLAPIEQAIIDTQKDAAGRKKLEKALADMLASGISRSAQDYVCRRLRTIGTGQSVKALAALLCDEKSSDIARFALGDICCCPTALDAIREALPKVSTKLRPGIIGSLGTHRDKKSVAALTKLMGDKDVLTARAAAHSLGLIGTPDAAKALCGCAGKAPEAIKTSVADAGLICAEQLLADGDKAAAIALYKGLKGDGMPKHVKVAAMKGMLTAASKK